jgi:hypothetical protein
MPLPAPVLASGAFDGLLLLLFAVLGFALVAVVAVVVLAIVHAVLPAADEAPEEPEEPEEPPPSTCDSA